MPDKDGKPFLWEWAIAVDDERKRRQQRQPVRWWVVALAIVLSWALTCFGPTSAEGQQAPGARWEVATEVGAGALLDLAARGPWVAPSWRRSLAGRLVIAVGTSALYEYGVEVWNGVPNRSQARDFQLRLAGTLGTEFILWYVPKVLFNKQRRR